MWIDDVRAFRSTFNYSDSDWVGTKALKQKIKDHSTKNPGAGLSLDLFNEIGTWKLDRQESRTRHTRGEKVTEDFVRQITSCAFSLAHSDRESLTRGRLYALQAIPGVGMGVSSAIVALSFPEQYGVIDPIVWKVIYGKKKQGFSLSDYNRYLEDLLSASSILGWPPEEVDFFAWK